MDKLLKVNSGFIPSDPTPTDYIASGITGITYEERNPSADWQEWLPGEERQAFRYFDSMSCVTFAAMNSMETQINYLYRTNQIPPWLLRWLNEKGYFVDDKINFSDRFIAKLSGTTQNGNTFQKVWDAIRKCGLIPEKDWPSSDEFSWDKFFAPIPQSVKDKGLEFLKYFNIQYEWITHDGTASIETLERHLKQAPLELASAVCPEWFNNSIVSSCNYSPSHATCIYDQESAWVDIFDTYSPFQKRLARDYKLWYVMKGLISVRTWEIKEDSVRHAWVQRPDLQIEFPSKTGYYSISAPNYNRENWARDFGVYEMPEVFSLDYQGKEVILQIEGTESYYLFGGELKPIDKSQYKGELKVITPQQADEMGLEISKEPVKKNLTLWQKIIRWFLTN